MEFGYPEYYFVGARPVKVVKTAAGGLDCLAYNWDIGEFETNLDYMAKVHFIEGEVDEVDESTFNQQVEKLRQKIRQSTTPVKANR
jgi:hypothetical protein